MSRKKTNGHAAAEIALAAEVAATIEADAAAAATDVATETLTGDVRDFILQTLRYEQDKRPWHTRSEAEQRDIVHRVESHAQDLVRRAVELIAAQGRRTIAATLESVTVKEGIKATLMLSRSDEQRHALTDSVGARVLVVVADPEEFTGERAPAEINPDQGDLEAAVVHSAAEDNHDSPLG